MTERKHSRALGWFLMTRAPFHTVGVFPFVLGSYLAHEAGPFSWPVFWLGTISVMLIMLATYFNGEHYDFREDTLSVAAGKSAFAGGSGAIPADMVPREYARRGGLAATAAAIVLGLVLAFGFGTGPWTVPLGAFGLLAGFFYSAPPFRWVATGFGELFIGICYGWLPVATAYYLQRGTFAGLNHWLTVPIGLSIFNVILINEFPDHPADVATGKRNMAARLGLPRAAVIYISAAVLSWLFAVLAVNQGAPRRLLLFYLPVSLLSLAVILLVALGRYRSRKVLEGICGMTIVVNLATTLAFLLGYVWRE